MKTQILISKRWDDCPTWWKKFMLHVRRQSNFVQDKAFDPFAKDIDNQIISEELAKYNAVQKIFDDTDAFSRAITFENENNYNEFVAEWS